MRPCLAVLLPLLLAGPLSVSGKGEPFRGLWVVRHNLVDPEGIGGIARRAREAGFNALLVQVRGRGDAYYRSRLVPRAEELAGAPEGFDPLGAAVAAARREGLQVHAWFNVFLAWYRADRTPASDRHVLRAHPDWFMVAEDGADMGGDLPPAWLRERGLEGRYLSPSVDAAREHLLRAMEELVRSYDLDGLHLDYVRYPGEAFDHHGAARSGFRKAFGEAEGGQEAAWRRWRADRISTFVAAVRKRLQEDRPRLLLSAAVKPELEEAYSRYGQDWVRWLNRGWIDFAVPMFYVGPEEEVSAQMRTARKYVRRGGLYAGIGAWNQSGDTTAAQVAAALELGLDGVAVFSYDTLVERPDVALRLRTGPFRE